MTDRPYHVLFLCTGNSGRSIMAEALVNYWGRGRFQGFSAGSDPQGWVHPVALELLERMKLPTQHLRSKSWGEFAERGSPPLDFVFTICDRAAGETCPIWPGRPMTAHWGIADPAAVKYPDSEVWRAFRLAFHELEHRIRTFVSLPIGALDRPILQRRLVAIGTEPPGCDG